MNSEAYIGNLGDLLLREGLVDHASLEEALRRQRETNQPLGRILVDMNAITESVKLSFFNKKFGCQIVSLKDVEIPDLLYSYIPRTTAVRARAVPYRLEGDTLVVAMEDPSDLETLDNLKKQVGLKIRHIASYSDIETALADYPDVGGEAGLGAEAMAARKMPPVVRAFKYLFFPVLAFAPLVVAVLMLFNQTTQAWMATKPWGFDLMDLTISGILIWALWALLVFEIDGIFVNPEHREERPRL